MFLKNGLLLIIALALLAFVGQASAGPNANAVLSLDIDASDNKMDDSNTSGTVEGAGTDVVVEVFISGLAGPIGGGVLSFDTDLLTVKSVALGAGFPLGTATTANISIGILPPANLTNGHLATVTFTTASDVTGMEFQVGASVSNLAAASGGDPDMLTAAMPLTFNAAMPPTTTPPVMMGQALDLDIGNPMWNDGNTSGSAQPGDEVSVEVFTGMAGPISGAQITFSQAIQSMAPADGMSLLGEQDFSTGKVNLIARVNGGGIISTTLNDDGYLGTFKFALANVPATVRVTEFIVVSPSGISDTLDVANLRVMFTQVSLRAGEMTSQPGSAMVDVTATGFAADAAIRFDVMPEGAATVSGEGATRTVTATGAGTVNVTVTASVGDLSVSFPITFVIPPPVLTTAGEMTSQPGSAMVDVTATGFAADAAIRFDVMPEGAATVSGEGATRTVTATGAGTVNVTVTASVGDLSVSFPITFVIPPPVLTTAGEMTSQPGSAMVDVTATGFAADAAIRFDVMPEGAATVSGEGATRTVTATGAGTVNVTVTASVGDLSVSFPITFEIPPPVLTYTKPEPDKIPLGGSSMVTVTAMGFASDDIRFNVMPTDAPVTKSEDGATATLTATDATTVTVTATDGTTISDPVSIEFQHVPYLMPSKTLALVYEDSSATVTVTARHFPAVMFVPSIKNSEGEVTITQEENVYTVTSNGQATVMVTATDATNPDISETIEITFRNAPKLMADANMVLVHRDSSVKTAMATVTAMGFPADADIRFNVMPEGAVTKSEDGAIATLTATDATTVTVTATDGEVTTSPVSIEFQLDPYLEVDKVRPVVIPSGGSAVVKVTARDYPDGAEIAFRVFNSEGTILPISLESVEVDNVLTLTVSGPGSATMVVEATDGTTSKTATIQVIQPPELRVSEELSDSPITIPLEGGEAGSVKGSVTALNFPADAALEFSVDVVEKEDAAEVDWEEGTDDLTLTVSGSGSATVMVSVSSGKYNHLTVDPITLQFIHPRLVANADSLIILPDSPVVATITAKDFPAEAEVKFDIRKEADESVTVEQAIKAREVVLTARGSGSATVTVMASFGAITAAPAVIQFDQPAPIDPPPPPGPQPALMSDVDEYVIPPDGDVMATITAMNFREGVTFNWVKVDTEGPEVTIDEMASQGKLTLTASGSGTATVEVQATDGATSVTDTIQFIQPSLMLVSDAEAEDNQVMIPHNGRGMVVVTAKGPLPAGAVVAFGETPENVERVQDGVTLTLTSSSATTVTVTASAAEGKIAADPITIQFNEYQPRLVSSADSVVIPSDGSVMATVTAVDFPADAEITFDVQVDADGSTKVEHSQEGAALTLTASGSGSATVTVMASAGEITAAPAVIQFDPPDPPGPQPALMSDADEYVIPPDGNVMATITAMNFPEGANIAFNWANVETEGSKVTIDEMEEGAVLTLTASGSGTATVEVQATDGATSVADTIQFIQPSLMLVSDAEDNQVIIPHNGSGMVMVTAEGSLPTGAVVAFAVTPEDAVELARDGATLTLTSSSEATVTVTASAADGEITAEITIQFFEYQPRLELSADSDTNEFVIPSDSSVVATVTAVDFPADAEITFDVQVDADGSTKVEHSQEGAALTLTASGSGSATVVVTASSGEGENRITASYTIRFVPPGPQPALMSDAEEYVIPPDGNVMATITAMNFPEGANIAFNWAKVETEGPEVTIDEMEEGAVLTLTASGSGTATVEVMATDGATSVADTIRFIQPSLMLVSDAEDNQVMIPHNGSGVVMVTAEGPLPTGAVVAFGETPENVERVEDGVTLTLTSSSATTVTVTASAAEGEITAEITIRFIEYQPRLVSNADSDTNEFVIPSDGNVMAMVTAVDFPADAEITFNVQVDADGSTKVEHSQEGAALTLTASGSGSATVVVTASSGEGENRITASDTIRFVPPGPQPALMSVAEEYVIPPNGNVMATIIAMNFPKGAKIAFNWAKVETEGSEVTIDEMEEGAVLTLTASGSGTATVEVKATDGATSVADTIRFIQPSLMLVSDAEDKTVTVILSDTGGEITQVMIPHNGSGMVMVTAEGPLPADAMVAFAVTPEDAVELARDGATLTLTSNSAATVTVMASAAEGEITADPITVQFIEPRPRLESLVGDAVVIPLEDSVMAMVAAVDFPADAEITFNVQVDADGSTKVEHSQEGADLTLIASGSGSATVTVMASAAEGEITAEPITIQFDQARLVSDSDADEYVIPPDSSVVATVTAVGFPNGITYSWVRVETDGPEVTIDEMEEGVVLTLTASGSGAVTVMVKGTGGGITREIMLQFGQPQLPDPPDLSVDREVSDEIVSLPRGGIPAIVRVTAENFPADAEITFEVDIAGAATVEHSDDGSVLTLEVTGPGAAIVKVMATDGTTTVEKIIQFDEQVAVELSSFVGEVVEERVVLNWVTASQTNNAGFRVLRSTDRENYEVVSDLIAGAGTTDQLMDYTFEDASLPAVERVYYVLEQIDIDGTVHRSNPVEVMLGARFLLPKEFSSFVYPNPFNPSTTISYDLPSDADVSIVIYDAIGQEIRQLVSEYRAAGRYSVRWDATDHRGRSVGSGVYIAKIKAGQHTVLQKMLLLK